MKIIKEGKIPSWPMKCKYCNTEFEYEATDVGHHDDYKNNRYSHLFCPLCKNALSWLTTETIPTEL